MSKQMINEILVRQGRFLNQHNHAHALRDILQILARNFNDAVPDYGLKLYRKHGSPLSISASEEQG